jgi:hypothetical protein
MLNIEEIETTLAQDIINYGQQEPRTLQSKEGTLGPSDIGFCRNKAVLTLRQAPRDPRSTAAAQMGTAIHTYLSKVYKHQHPDWIIPEVDWEEGQKITARFNSGIEVAGTPDIIVPEWNAIIDIKTVDDFTWVKREGTTTANKFQRWIYAKAAIQSGILDPVKTAYVGNLYISRKGSQEVVLDMEPMDPMLESEIDSWIEDVIYAIKTGEEAAKDIVATRCESMCEFFTTCRGTLPVSGDTILIEDEDQRKALRMYVAGRDMEKEAKAMKETASAILHGINGSDGEFYVRWTETMPTEIAGFTRKGGWRIDVNPVKKPKTS